VIVNVRDRSSETHFSNPHTSILTQESVVCPGRCKRCRIYVIQGADLGSLGVIQGDVIQGADLESLGVIQGADLGSLGVIEGADLGSTLGELIK
jgi:hypothetical protein